MANAILPAVPNHIIASHLEPQPSGKWLRDLHNYSIFGDNVVSRILTKIHNQTDVSKAVCLKVLVGFAFLILLFARDEIQQSFSTLLIVSYPTYCSSVVLTGKSVENADNVSKWLLFWTIYVTFEPLEPFLARLPFYWLIKTLFVLALCLPPIDLCGKWNKEWIKPLVCLSQNRFDYQTFLDAHPLLLKEMNLELGTVKTYDEFVLKKELSKHKVEDILLSLYSRMPFNVPLSVGSIYAIASIPKNFCIVQSVT